MIEFVTAREVRIDVALQSLLEAVAVRRGGGHKQGRVRGQAS
jgi:hypothetical protein